MFLSTARFELQPHRGDTLVVQALLDSDSDTSLLSESAAQIFRLPRKHAKVAISEVQGC